MMAVESQHQSADSGPVGVPAPKEELFPTCTVCNGAGGLPIHREFPDDDLDDDFEECEHCNGTGVEPKPRKPRTTNRSRPNG